MNPGKLLPGIVLALIVLAACSQQQTVDIEPETFWPPRDKVFEKASLQMGKTDNLQTIETNTGSTIPRCADVSVMGIELDSPTTTRQMLGKDIKLDQNQDMPMAHYYNKTGEQILTLVFHPGNVADSFSEFCITKVDKKFLISLPILKEIEIFATGKGIHVGMNYPEVVDILGAPHEEKSEKHGGWTEKVLRYEITDGDSAFLRKYNIPKYYGKYTFWNNCLKVIEFGFEYP